MSPASTVQPHGVHRRLPGNDGASTHSLPRPQSGPRRNRASALAGAATPYWQSPASRTEHTGVTCLLPSDRQTAGQLRHPGLSTNTSGAHPVGGPRRRPWTSRRHATSGRRSTWLVDRLQRSVGCLCYLAAMWALGRIHSPSRRLTRIICPVLLVVIVFLVSTARLFVWPPSDAPSHVDAIVALGGDPGQRRMKFAVQLAKAGYASVVVISLGGDPKVRCPPTSKKLEVICFRPNPVNTRGEAEFVARLAAQRHWDRVIVVPDRTQTTRARLLFKRCTRISLEMVPVQDDLSQLFAGVPYEWGALIKALILNRSC